MAKALTAISVDNVRPTERRQEIPDGGCRGLYLVVQSSGSRSWAVRYRFGGKTRKLTFTAASLAEARRRAAEALHAVDAGTDPAAKAVEEKEAATARDADTVERWAAAFIERHAKKKTRRSTCYQYEGIFRRDVLPAWVGRTVHDVRRRDVIDLVEGIAEDRPVMANRARGMLSKFFNWLASRDVIESSPCAGVTPPSEERVRKRYLSDDEVARLWRACSKLPAPFDDIYRLLLLLGPRRQGVGEMQWNEITNGTQPIWTVTSERSKNKQTYTVPLSRQAWAIITAQPRIVGTDYVFGRRRTGFSHMKEKLDAEMRLNEPWRTHDLRRTIAAGMQRLGVETRVIEHVLGHKSGEFKGIVGVYQVHEFDKEKAAALQRWADHVERICS
jgi:integrase